jgi:hypothetical protein
VSAAPRPRDEPAATIEVWKGERRLAKSSVRWNAPDSAGLLRHVAELPVTGLGPGRYEVRATVSDGDTKRVLRAALTVAE